MAISIRVELNKKNVGALLKSDDVRFDMLQRAKAIEEQAGTGYIAVSEVGHDRAFAIVRTDSYEAREQEATQHTLLNSIEAGKL